MENKQLEGSILIPAPVEAVWNAWTTEHGIRSFLAPDCLVVAEPNGPFEIYFRLDEAHGLRGTEGCRMMAVMPYDLLSFSWNFPPHLTHIRHQKTQVCLRFAPEGMSTRLHFVQTGWANDPEWNQGFEFFQDEWFNLFLPRLRWYFLNGPVDWRDPPSREALATTGADYCVIGCATV
ncbi:hypothetical protein ATO46_15945 [Aeromonas schubertii]|uniref:SRPBCC family protein n=1 Tax=Aeromonas schubertii TaxID=652 RepID=UPI00067E8281|nr:SRPBCC domain-containing protein [Aeromonas schubertii]KUE80596.1 hypothetical protein ATO46_15945 [Aeromonas schubertii]